MIKYFREAIICWVGALGSVDNFIVVPLGTAFGSLIASEADIWSLPDLINASSSSAFCFLSIYDNLFDLKLAIGISFVPSTVSSSDVGPLLATTGFLFAASESRTF